MPRVSAGLMMYRRRNGDLEILLVHPGGPFWRNKDEGAWTIPKGEPDKGEELLATARREFEEETGLHPMGPYLELTPVQQTGGKMVHAWAFEGDFDPRAIKSNTFRMEWPAGSGRFAAFPEIDRAEFFSQAEARTKINPAQAALVDELDQKLTRS